MITPRTLFGFDLPDSWELAVMDDIAAVVGGSTPKSKESSYWGGSIPWLAVSDLTDYEEKYISGGARTITRAGYESCATQLLPAGSVVFSSRAPIGYVAITTEALCTSQGFRSFVPVPSMSPEYLYWYLKAAKPLAEALASGTTFKEISGRAAKTLPISIPPRPEQNRIVAAIEGLMDELKAGLHALDESERVLQQFRASILAAAVTGRLTAAGEDTESATELLDEVMCERRSRWERDQLAVFEAKRQSPRDDRWKDRYKQPAEPAPSVGIELPSGWTWATVDQLATLVQYGSSSRTGEDKDGVPVLRMGNIVEGRLRLGGLKYLSRDHKEFPDLFLRNGDVLFNRTNSPELVGKAAVFCGELEPCSFASYLIRVHLTPHYRPHLLVYFLSSALGRAWVRSVVSQQVGQANVNGTKLKQLTVPVPPPEEQEKICRVAEDQLRMVDEMQRTISEMRERARQLQHAVLHKAFSGQLVPQNPSDEPAVALLKRARAQREEREKCSVRRQGRRPASSTA